MGTPTPSSAPDVDDLRGLARGLRAGERPPVLRGPYFAEILAEMNSEHHALTRALLGAGADAGEPTATDHRHRARKVR